MRVIKSYRVRWLGHVLLHEDSEPAKKLTFLKIVGTRRRLRPATKLLDCAEKDSIILGVNR